MPFLGDTDEIWRMEFASRKAKAAPESVKAHKATAQTVWRPSDQGGWPEEAGAGPTPSMACNLSMISGARPRLTSGFLKIIVGKNCTIIGQMMKHADTGVESVELTPRSSFGSECRYHPNGYSERSG